MTTPSEHTRGMLTTAVVCILFSVIMGSISLGTKGWLRHDRSVECEEFGEEGVLKVWIGLRQYSLEFNPDGNGDWIRKSGDINDFKNPVSAGGEKELRSACVTGLVLGIVAMVLAIPPLGFLWKMYRGTDEHKTYVYGANLALLHSVMVATATVMFAIIRPVEGTFFEHCMLGWSYIGMLFASLAGIMAGLFIHKARRYELFPNDIIVTRQPPIVHVVSQPPPQGVRVQPVVYGQQIQPMAYGGQGMQQQQYGGQGMQQQQYGGQYGPGPQPVVYTAEPAYPAGGPHGHRRNDA